MAAGTFFRSSTAQKIKTTQLHGRPQKFSSGSNVDILPVLFRI